MKKDDIRETLNRFRTAILESEEETKKENKQEEGDWYESKRGGIPYSQQDELLTNAIQSAKELFGADFTNIKTPMFYYKEDGDVTLSGVIPGLNDAKFQLRLKDPSGMGVFFWSGKGAMILSDENIQTLSRINGFFKNWKKEMTTAEDIRPTSFRNEE